MFEGSAYTYGSPRIHAALKADGESVGRHQIARLMRHHGLVAKMTLRRRRRAISRRVFYIEGARAGCCPVPAATNGVWVGDITQINTRKKPFYLAAVMDRFSRRILGCAMSEARDARLVCRALMQATVRRHGKSAKWFHSDQGVEYGSHGHRGILQAQQTSRSVSRRGNCYDNAHIESFFHSLKTEMVYFQAYDSMEAGMQSIRKYIHYYNTRRRHSALGYLSPIQFETAVA